MIADLRSDLLAAAKEFDLASKTYEREKQLLGIFCSARFLASRKCLMAYLHETKTSLT